MQSAATSLFTAFARTGEPESLAEVYALTRGPLLRLARRLAPDDAMAEDLVHATFVLAVDRAGSFDPARPLLPWLHAILANEAHRVRRRAARERPDDGEQERHGFVAEPWLRASQCEAAAVLQHAIALLPERDQLVLRLQLDRGLDASEIGRRLGRPAATVRQQIARARGRLRRMLPRGLAMVLLAALSTAARAARGRGLAAAAAVAIAATLWGWFAAGAGAAARPAARAEVAVGPTATVVEQAATGPGAARVALEAPAPAAIGATPAAPRVRVRYQRDGALAAGVFLHVRPLALPDPALHDLWLETDASGEALLPAEVPGPFRVRVDRAGSAELAAGTPELEYVIPDGYDVEGFVAGADGAPLCGAHVWLSAEESDTAGGDVARTGADGRFVLRSLRGRRHLHARTGAHASAMVAIGGVARQTCAVRLCADRPCSSVTGSVVDPAGRPVAGAIVTAGMPRYGAFGADAPVRSARSGADGRFVVDGVPLGRTSISAQAPGSCGSAVMATVTREPIDAGGLALHTGAVVVGCVRDAQGAPIAGARVGWMRDLDWDASGCRSGADGAFRVRVPVPAAFELWVNAGAHGMASRPLAGLVEGETVRWDPRLDGPRVPLRGVLRDAAGKPLPGWRVHAVPTAKQVRAPGPWSAPVVTATDGSFELAACEPRAHRLALTPPELPFALRPWLEVAPGEPAELAVAANQWPDARIAGRVVGADGLPAPAAAVLLTQSDALARWPLQVDAEGRFEVAGLPAGPYIVEVTLPGTRTNCVPITLRNGDAFDVGVVQTGTTKCANKRTRFAGARAH